MTDNSALQIRDSGRLRSKSLTKWVGGFLVAFLTPRLLFLTCAVWVSFMRGIDAGSAAVDRRDVADDKPC
jgi:hypothetical protein